MGGFGPSLTGSLDFGLMEYPKNIAELFGAPGGVAKDIYDGFHSIIHGEVWKGTEKLLPTAAAAPLKAIRQSTEGFTTAKDTPIFYGKDPLKFDMTEAIMQGFSFSPARTSMIRDKQWGEKKKAAAMQEELSNIYSYAKRVFMKPYDDRTEADVSEITARMAAYNNEIESDKTLPLTKLNWRRIMTGVKRSMQPTKRERMRIVDSDDED
jgi:hypothetical protein